MQVWQELLLKSQRTYPEIDSEYYLKKIENIIENIKTSLRDETEPEQILKTMNIVLFNELQFKYVQTGNLEYISLNKVLDSKSATVWVCQFSISV